MFDDHWSRRHREMFSFPWRRATRGGNSPELEGEASGSSVSRRDVPLSTNPVSSRLQPPGLGGTRRHPLGTRRYRGRPERKLWAWIPVEQLLRGNAMLSLLLGGPRLISPGQGKPGPEALSVVSSVSTHPVASSRRPHCPQRGPGHAVLAGLLGGRHRPTGGLAGGIRVLMAAPPFSSHDGKVWGL